MEGDGVGESARGRSSGGQHSQPTTHTPNMTHITHAHVTYTLSEIPLSLPTHQYLSISVLLLSREFDSTAHENYDGTTELTVSLHIFS